MKRTLIVATTSYAGMGPYVSEIANLFTAKDNVFFIFRDYEDDFFRKNIKEELHQKSVFFKKANSKWNKLISLIPHISAFQKHVLSTCQEKKIELVHFINNPGPKQLVKKLEKTGIRVISSVHDLHPHEANKEWYKELRFKILYKQLQENLECGKAFITNSKFQLNELKTLYPEKSIFYHSFPSLITEKIKNGKETPPELVSINKPYILFFGRIEEYKGISLIYDAFLKSPEIHSKYILVIAGSGTIPFSKKDDEHDIIFINRYIKDDEVASLFKMSAMVIYPYFSATQSGVLSLSLYYGIPTITSDVPFFKGIMDDFGYGKTFKNKDVADLIQSIIYISSNDRELIHKKSQEYYKHNYDNKVIHSELVKIYSSI